MATWINGPTLSSIKIDAAINDDRDDQILQQELDAAVAYVQRVRKDLNYDGDPLNCYPAPGADFVLGVQRQVIRWHARRRSPDAAIAMGDLGTSRVPTFDADIERVLGIGRYHGPAFA
jgi:hypothetical protein